MKNQLRIFKSELGTTYLCFINKSDNENEVPVGYVNGNPFDESYPHCDFYIAFNTEAYNKAKKDGNLPILQRWDTNDTPWDFNGGMIIEADDFDVETFALNLTYLSMSSKRFFYIKDGKFEEFFTNCSKAKKRGYL